MQQNKIRRPLQRCRNRGSSDGKCLLSSARNIEAHILMPLEKFLLSHYIAESTLRVRLLPELSLPTHALLCNLLVDIFLLLLQVFVVNVEKLPSHLLKAQLCVPTLFDESASVKKISLMLL